MKKFYPAFCLIVICCATTLSAQDKSLPLNEPDYNKPELFANLPGKIVIPAGEIISLFLAERGQKVSVGLTSDTRNRFEGEITSVVYKYGDSVQTVSVLASNFKGARFVVSKLITREGAINYMGRIISFAHSDVYQLVYNKEEFLFIKKNWYDLVNE